jgi:DNA replication protein DnaC
VDQDHIESTYRKRRHYDAFEDEILATALLDRLLHHVEVISISGKSFRMKDRVAAGKSKAAAAKQG